MNFFVPSSCPELAAPVCSQVQNAEGSGVPKDTAASDEIIFSNTTPPLKGKRKDRVPLVESEVR